MGSCIVEKFRHYTDLTKSEESLLSRLEEEKKTFKAGQIISQKGHHSDHLYTIYDGWTYISSTVDTDIRSIFDIRLEADFVGVSEISFDKKLYDFVALTDVTVCPFPKDHLDDILRQSDNLRNVLLLIISREQAMMYERIISLSRRTAMEKVAHFLCETSVRLGMIGGHPQHEFDFPLRQDHIADILGLSSVHTSRSMTTLKKNGYIDYTRSKLVIKDAKKLFNLAYFSKEFLLDPKKNNRTI